MRVGQGVAAVFSAAAAQSVATFGLLAVSGFEHPEWGVWLFLSAGWFVCAALLAAVIMLLPFQWLERRGRLGWAQALAVGAIDGLIVTAFNSITGGLIDTGSMWHALADSEWVSIAGALAGWAAWRVLVRKVKPDDAAQVF